MPPQIQSPRRPIGLADAIAFVLRSYGLAVQPETAPTEVALGRVLARDLIAGAALPRFDAAAVDGYALRAADLAASGETRLTVAGRAAAGHPAAAPLRPGQALRIFTGAPVPPGADRVVMQEDCRAEEGAVTVATGTAGGADIRRANIRRAGEDIEAGALAIAAGTRLGPGHLALAAALGAATLSLYRRPRVALFSTGDELAGSDPAPGRILDANRPLLRALLAAAGAAVTDGGVLPDRPDAQIAALLRAAQESDLIVTSGGMSVGEEDHLPGVIRRRGHLEVWRLRIKPGKPVGLGDIDDCPILALPGNPVAAALTFLLLGVPLLARLGGGDEARAPTLRLPLARTLDKRAGRWEALPARLVEGPGGATAVAPMAKTGSAMLTGLAGADGFLCLPEEAASVAAGTPVEVILLPRG